MQGTKHLTDEEQRVAYRDDHPYKPGAEKGYPVLIRRGKQLRANGVEFVDLTGLFEDREDTIYIDDCCHYNVLGNNLLANRVADVILANSQTADLDN